jgi:signal recognition particle subunit SRP54
MTPGERTRPEIIDKSRMSRIAKGSGRRSKDVRELLGRFTQMREMMSQMGSGGMLGKIPGFGKMAGAGGFDPTALLGGPGGKPGKGRREAAGARGQQKGKRKQARKARRKNRRR